MKGSSSFCNSIYGVDIYLSYVWVAIAVIFMVITMFDKLFSRHMKIERMLITCGLLLSVIMLVLIYDGVTLHKRSKVTLSDAPILSGSSTTSLSGQTFNVQGVYTSKDCTQAMVVIAGDLSAVSYSADMYQVCLIGPSANEFSGGLYVFGDLNLMCVYVTDMNQFKAEKTQIILKSKNSSTASSVSETDDMSFVVNFGASGAETVSFMSDSGLDIENMASSAFFYEDDTDIKTELKTLQANNVAARVTLNNVRENLDAAGLQLPAFPEWMPDDNLEYRDDTNSEYITTSYVFAGAADFDWENATRLDNYADMAGISADSIDPDAKRPDVSDDIPTEWYRTDNSLVTEPTKSEQALMAQYTTALQAYYDAKIAYQDKVAELISAQNNYLTNMRNYTSNVGGEAIVGVKQKLK